MLPGWVRRHRWPLAVAAVLAAYALAGFVLAPWLLGRQIVSLARDQLGREASVGAIAVNPFALSLRVADFQLKDPDGSRLAGFDELRINLEAAGLFRRAWTFSEFTVAGPYLKLVRDAAGEINLQKLLPPAVPEPPATEKPGLPRLIVRRLRIEQGVIDLTDEVPATAFHTRVGPFGIALDELSTLPDVVGEQDIAVTLESGTQLGLAGDFTLNPLRVSGRFTLHGPVLGPASRYLRDQLRFRVAADDTELAARFVVTGQPDGGIEAAVDDLALSVSGLRLGADAAPDFLGWSRLQLAGGRLRWPALAAEAQTLTLEGLQLRARRARDGTIDLVQLFTPAGSSDAPVVSAEAPPAAAEVTTGQAAAVAAPASPRLHIGEIVLRDAAVELVDEGPSAPATWAVTDLDFSLRDLGNEPGARLPFEAAVVLGSGGSIGLEGNVVALPTLELEARVHAQDIALAAVQPYLTDVAHVGIRAGSLGVEGQLKSAPGEALAFDGDIRVRGLDTRDRLRDEPLLAWQELGLDDLEFRLDGHSARLARIRLLHPFARVFVNRDQTTNIGALFVEPGPAVQPAATASPVPKAPPFHVRAGKVVVTQGEVDYTDLSLPLPFAARVQELKGEFTTIDSASTAPAKIALEGRVAPYGLAKVNGELRVSAPTDLADLGVLFRNIEMPPLSPYTVKFAGRRIAQGKISLDLHYRLDHRRMVGSNKLVIDELELGDKVPSPEAVDLPLGLAVALLKDADGRIDLDMPVEGSLDDPQFRIGGVLWQAFVKLVTRVVSSPFRLLGSLLGIGAEDLGHIDFIPGRADLLPPEQEKLARLAEALGKRPELALEVPAVVAPAADAAALRTAQADARIAAALAAAGGAASGRKLEQRTRRVVESLYEERFPGRRLADVEARNTVPPPDDPQGRPRLDELAYVDALRAELATGEEVDDAALSALGAARATAISTELTGPLQIPAARVRVGGRKDVEARDGQWVPGEIGVSGGGD